MARLVGDFKMIQKICLLMIITFFCNAKGFYFWGQNTKTSTESGIYGTSEKTTLENESGTGEIIGSEIRQPGQQITLDYKSSTETIAASDQPNEATSFENELSTETTMLKMNQPSNTTPLMNDFSTTPEYIPPSDISKMNQSSNTTPFGDEFSTTPEYIPPSTTSKMDQLSNTTPFENELSSTPANTPSTSTKNSFENVSKNTSSLPGNTTNLSKITINPDDYENVTSIQETLKEMKSNEMIERNIIKTMNEFFSNCDIYKPIILSTKNFTLAPEQKIKMGNITARFYNFRISELNEENEEWKTFTTTIGCDSSHNSDINVSIPSKITTSADLEIIGSSNEVFDKGSIAIILRGVNILRQFFKQEKKDVTRPEVELTFEKSEVALDINMAYQLEIYRRLDTFFNTLKPLREYYLSQLQQKMEQEGIPPSFGCSHEVDSAISETQPNLYVIDNVKLETYKGLSLSAGPVLIDGLLNFDSSKFTIQKPDTSILKPNDVSKKVIKQIKTKNLKGKFEWQYRGETNVLSFTIDRIIFESIFTKKDVIGQGGTAVQNTVTSNIDTDIKVVVGNVEVDHSQEKYCKNENHFANFILSGYLQSVVGDLLHNSIRNRMMSELTLGKCVNF